MKEVVRDGLLFGDYGCEYLEDGREPVKCPVFFERKSIPDLFGTLTNEERHERLRKRLLDAREVGAKMILAVEGTDRQVMSGIPRSHVKGSTVMKIVDTLWYKYDLMPLFCADRRMMAWRMVNLWKTFRKLYDIRERGGGVNLGHSTSIKDN